MVLIYHGYRISGVALVLLALDKVMCPQHWHYRVCKMKLWIWSGLQLLNIRIKFLQYPSSPSRISVCW